MADGTRAVAVNISENEPLLRTSTGGTDDESQKLSQDDPNVSQVSLLRGTAIAVSIWLLIFILTCNVSIVMTIQSPIASELEASSEVSWFTSAYLIAITSVTPTSGKFCQIFTSRRYLLASVIIEVIGLLFTSQARSLHVFLVGRVVSGVGAAAVTPVSFILVTELVSKKRRAIFFGLINTGYTSGLALGGLFAGLLEPVIGWHSVFLTQIPIVSVAGIVAFVAIPNRKSTDEDEQRNEPSSLAAKLASIDYFGMATLILSLVLCLYTLSSPHITAVPLLLALSALLLFILVETQWAVDPIIPPSILQSRANILTGIASVGVMSARWGVLFYTPVYAIAVRGWSQSTAGLLIVPTNAGFASGGVVAGWLHIRKSASYYYSTLTCFFIFAVIQFVVSRIAVPDSPISLFVVTLFFNGFVVGGLLNYSLAHLLYLTHPDSHVIVLPLNAMFRSFSGSFGSAIAGGYFVRTLQTTLQQKFIDEGLEHRAELVRQLLGRPLLVQSLQGMDHKVAVDSYAIAIKATLLGGSLLAVLMMLVQAGTGRRPPIQALK